MNHGRQALIGCLMIGTIGVGNSRLAATEQISPWAELATADVEALHHSVVTLHPGMRDPANPGFPAQVERANVDAVARARAARSFSDWRDVTQGFVLSFRDGHSIFRTTVAPTNVRWPGFLIDGRADGWVVRRPAGVVSHAALPREGSRLIACDGIAAETLLRERLDGRSADWTKEPERLRQAYRLFIDDRPGGTSIKSCDFQDGTGRQTVSLDWQLTSWAGLQPAFKAYLREADRPIDTTVLADGAALVRLGSFGEEARLESLAKSLEEQPARLRAAPYVVFDLRGNRGGNSTWGTRFAAILWGQAAVNARQAAQEFADRSVQGKLWRASPEAAQAVRGVAARFEAEGPEMAKVAGYWRGVAKLIEKAPSGDKALVRDPCCDADPGPRRPPSMPSALFARPVFVLVDAGCFSSCVLAANTLLHMGAIAVGEPSGQNEEYGEIAGPITLPSGLGRYYVPLTIIRQRRDALIVKPTFRWVGAMDDDSGILKWIASLMASRSVQGGNQLSNVPERTGK